MNIFRLTTVKNTMLIYVNSFRLCHPLLFGFVTVQNWKNNGKKPNMTIMFPFNNVFKHATVCLFSIYYEEWSKSDIPTANWSRIPIVRQFDNPTEMCLFFTFIVRVRTAAKWTLYGENFIHLGEEIVNFFNSMTFSKWRPYEFRGGGIFG